MLRVPIRLATRRAIDSGSLSWAYPWSCLQSPPFFLTFQWASNSCTLAHSFPITFLGSQSRALSRLSSVASSTISPSFVSLPPALINMPSKSPGLMLWNLFCTKSRTHRLLASLRQTCSRPGSCPVTPWPGPLTLLCPRFLTKQAQQALFLFLSFRVDKYRVQHDDLRHVYFVKWLQQSG